LREHRHEFCHLDAHVVLVCQSGSRAAQAAERLTDAGLVNVRILDGPGSFRDGLADRPPRALGRAAPGSPLPSGRRLRLADLTEYPSVLGPAGTSACELVEQALGDIGLTPVVAVETTQHEAIVPLIMTGACAAAVAGFAPPLTRPVTVIHRTGDLSPAAHAFLAAVN